MEVNVIGLAVAVLVAVMVLTEVMETVTSLAVPVICSAEGAVQRPEQVEVTVVVVRQAGLAITVIALADAVLEAVTPLAMAVACSSVASQTEGDVQWAEQVALLVVVVVGQPRSVVTVIALAVAVLEAVTPLVIVVACSVVASSSEGVIQWDDQVAVPVVAVAGQAELVVNVALAVSVVVLTLTTHHGYQAPYHLQVGFSPFDYHFPC